jgi:hypothetical protein
MLWMGIWVHPYTVMPLQVWVNFWKIWIGLSPSDVVMSWLRLQAPTDCIQHPYHIYTKCFSILICCEWSCESTLTLLCLCRSGVASFWIIGVWLSSCDFVMSWLRLQTPVECIPHPYQIYTNYFSTLICCEWAYECTITLLRLCHLKKIGVGLSPSDVVMSLLRL